MYHKDGTVCYKLKWQLTSVSVGPSPIPGCTGGGTPIPIPIPLMPAGWAGVGCSGGGIPIPIPALEPFGVGCSRDGAWLMDCAPV